MVLGSPSVDVKDFMVDFFLASLHYRGDRECGDPAGFQRGVPDD
jgi:hypothetical protein